MPAKYRPIQASTRTVGEANQHARDQKQTACDSSAAMCSMPRQLQRAHAEFAAREAQNRSVHVHPLRLAIEDGAAGHLLTHGRRGALIINSCSWVL